MIAHALGATYPPKALYVSVTPSNRGLTGFVPFWLRRVSILCRFTITRFISGSHLFTIAS